MYISDGKGMGAYSTVPITKGTTLGEYTGEILSRRDVEARYWGTRKQTKSDRKWRNSRRRRNQGLSGDYLFDMGNDIFIDGEDADVSSWCRFANHATEDVFDATSSNNDDDDDNAVMVVEGACNVEVRRRLGWENEDNEAELRLFLVAIRDIDAGVEICYDYGEEYW